MARDRRKVDCLLLAPDLIYRLDEKWIKLRDEMLDGKVDPLEGIELFRCCVEAALRVIQDENGGKEAVSSRSQNSEIPVLDLGDDQDEEFADPDPTPQRLARVALATVLRPSQPLASKKDKPCDLIEDWRETMQKFYEDYGFHVEVPRPPGVSSEELVKWRTDGWDLFYRPAEGEASYKQMMHAFGHEDHATLRAEESTFFSWEPADSGYWFLAEAREVTPRSGRTFEEYMRETPVGQRLLCLEEYAILWHVMKDVVGAILDHDRSTLLQTRYKTEVLQARSHIDRTEIEFFVRGWPEKIAARVIGTRFLRVLPAEI